MVTCKGCNKLKYGCLLPKKSKCPCKICLLKGNCTDWCDDRLIVFKNIQNENPSLEGWYSFLNKRRLGETTLMKEKKL